MASKNIMMWKFLGFLTILFWTYGEAAKVTCHYDLFSYTGYIESLNFPNVYPVARNCTWVISTLSSHRVQLMFEVFDLEDHELCEYDHIDVYDGISNKGRLLGKFCGKTLPIPLISSKNSITIIFYSDAAIQNRGFRVFYTSVLCGGNFREEAGIFRSPSFPDNYSGHKKCIWTIETDKTKKVSLAIKYLQVSPSSNCSAEYLRILKGNHNSTSDSEFHLAAICNEDVTHNQNELTYINSPSNKMYIEFVSEMPIQGLRFSALFQSIPCGNSYKQDEGLIVSANYPENYPDSSECVWTITVSEGYRVALQFISFQVWYTVNCTSDFLEIRDGLSSSSPLIRNPICGHNVPGLIRSTSNNMRVRFRSDSAYNAKGFMIKFGKEHITWDDCPEEQDLVIGGDGKIRCSFLSYPTAVSWWTKNGQNLKESQQKGRYIIDTEGIRIPSVQEDDKGTFSITAVVPKTLLYQTKKIKVEVHDYLPTDEVLTISPAGKIQYHPVGKSFGLICQGKEKDKDLISEVEWKGVHGEVLTSGANEMNFASNGNMALLTFSSPTAKDSGNYSCIALYNNEQIKTSVNLIFHSDITWTNCPDKQNLIIGENGKIKCSVSSSPQASLTWIKKNGTWPDHYIIDTDGVRIPSVTEDDNGELTINAVILPTGIFQTRTIKIEVSVRKDITWEDCPEHQDLVLGEDEGIIKCHVSSNPPALVMWSKGNQKLPGHYVIDSNGIRISPVTEADNGEFIIEATIPDIGTVQTKRIRVQYRKDITWIECPEHQYVFIGDEGKIRCSVSSIPTPLVTWSKENQKWPNHYTIEVDGIRILPVSKEDEGELIVKAEFPGTGKYETRIIKINVRQNITWEDCLEQQYLMLDEEGKIRCIVSSIPPALVTWSKKNQKWPGHYITEEDGIRISSVSKEDKGAYFVTAEVSETGEHQTRTIEVEIRKDITWEDCPERQDLIMGDEGRIICNISAIPPAVVTWLKKDEKWPDHYVIDIGSVKISPVVKEDGGKFIVVAAVPDAGKYQTRIIKAEIQRRINVPSDVVPNACLDSSLDAATRMPNGSTYFFKGDFYWEMKVWGYDKHIYPRRIFDGWDGLEGNLDASFSDPSGTFFFKGGKYWKYIDNRIVKGFPRYIGSDLIGVPDNLDAAFYWSSKREAYLLKDMKYWRVKILTNTSALSLSSPSPEYFVQMGITTKVDAALQFDRRETYIFAGGEYYRFNPRNFTIEMAKPAYPRPISNWWFACSDTS